MRNFANQGVQGGDLVRDLKQWKPLHSEQDEESSGEPVDPGLDPEQALIAKEELEANQGEEDDDGVLNIDQARKEFELEDPDEL